MEIEKTLIAATAILAIVGLSTVYTANADSAEDAQEVIVNADASADASADTEDSTEATANAEEDTTASSEEASEPSEH